MSSHLSLQVITEVPLANTFLPHRTPGLKLSALDRWIAQAPHADSITNPSTHRRPSAHGLQKHHPALARQA